MGTDSFFFRGTTARNGISTADGDQNMKRTTVLWPLKVVAHKTSDKLCELDDNEDFM